MQRLNIWMLTPLLFIMVILIPFGGADAQPAHFSPSLSASELVSAVNALRLENNLAPYQLNPILMSVAQTHVDYIASTGVVTHFDANGTRPYQRAIDAGYAVAGDLALGGAFAENIHSGANLSPEGAVTFWKGSPAELSAMLSPDYKDIGAGMAIANGITYYVLNTGSSGDETRATTSTSTLSSSDAVISTAGAAGTEAVVVFISTPDENGEIHHLVQKNEALWSIAVAYGTTIEKLKLLNSLATDEIFEGQTLLVYKPLPATVTASPVITATFGIPTSTATRPVPPTIISTATPLPTPPTSLQDGGMILGIIVLIAFLAAGVGSWLSRQNKRDDAK